MGRNGNSIFITARNEADKLETVSMLHALGVYCKGFLLDLSSMESIDVFLNSFDEHIDILINNAGVHLKGSPANINKNVLSDSFNVNIIGLWHLTSGLIPFLSKSDNPKIINVSSSAGAIQSIHHSPI